LIFYLVIINKLIGNGSFGNVYEGIEKKTEKKVSIKVFLANNDSNSMERDIKSGIDERLGSEYTIIYEEVFVYKENMIAVMPLMKYSLEKYLKEFISLPGPKKLLSDEV
jgi:serine/threonine protein kinase